MGNKGLVKRVKVKATVKKRFPFYASSVVKEELKE